MEKENTYPTKFDIVNMDDSKSKTIKENVY